MAQRPRRGDHDIARAVGLAADRLDDQRAGAVGAVLNGEPRDGARAFRIDARVRDHADVAAGQFDEHGGGVRGHGFERRGGELARKQVRQHRRIHQPPHQRIVGVGGRADIFAGTRRLRGGHRDAHLFEIAGGAQGLEDLRGVFVMPIRGRFGAGLGGEASERELADRGLIPLADQLEHARALRDVVVRLGGACLARAQVTAQAEELAPGARRGARVEPGFHLRESSLRFLDAIRGEQRLGGDQLGFDGFRRRRVGGLGDLVGDGERFIRPAAPRREPRADHAQRPFIPAAGVAAVGAVGLGGLAQILRGILVVAAHQRHLRERVVHRAGGLVKLHRAANIERAVQHLVGAIEVADAHADLPERGERHREARSLAEAFMEIHGALGERQRLLVAMANQRDVGLVPVHGREHIVGLQHRRHALGLAERGVGFVVASGLRQHDRRQRVHHGEVATVAGGVQRRGSLGNVLADDGHVADLAITLPEIEVGEADGARVVGDFGLLERAVMQGDRARLFAARERDAAVQSPQIRVQDLRELLAERVGRPAQRRSGLCKIPLQEVRFSQHDADAELVFARKR